MYPSFLESLLYLSDGLSGVTELRHVRQLAAAGVAQASHSEACWLWLLDQGGTTLRPGATSGAPVPPWRWRVPLRSESLIARCLADGEPKISIGAGERAAVCVPLLGPARFVGALMCYRDPDQPYQVWEMEELTVLANFIGSLVGDVTFFNELGEVYAAGMGVLITAVWTAGDWLQARAETATHLALRLARRLSLGPVASRSIQWAALFHDVSPLVADRWLLSPREMAGGAPRTILAQGPLALLPGLELCLERMTGCRGLGLADREAALGARVATLAHEFVRLSTMARIASGVPVGSETSCWGLNGDQVLDILRQRQSQAWDGTVIETLHELIQGEPRMTSMPFDVAHPAFSWGHPAKAA